MNTTTEFGNSQNIQLVEKATTRTSRGMLSKAWYSIDGKLCMVKGNSKENTSIGYEPYSEVMAYKIGSLLGFNCVPYWLGNVSDFPEITSFGLDYVSICPNYLKSDESNLKFYEYVENILGYTDHSYWEDIVKGSFLEHDISEMLLLDALIGNEDRHLGNFDIVQNNITGKFYLSPIYDCGAGLLAWVPEENVVSESYQYQHDKSKPFRSKHKTQLKLIAPDLIRKHFGDHSFSEILSVIKDDLEFLSTRRRKSVITYLRWRWELIIR